jgi:hypothetical protein
MSLRTAEQMLVTSYDAEGERETSLHQLVPAGDGEVAFWVANDQGVRERFPENSVVSVRPATRRGRPVTDEPVMEGRAFVLAEGPVFEQVKKDIAEKYPESWTSTVSNTARKLFAGRTPECVVIIKLIG